MAMVRHHPKTCKHCVFCNYWIGNAKMKFYNTTMGYEYDNVAKGKCTKRHGAETMSSYSCNNYAPSVEASKLL